MAPQDTQSSEDTLRLNSSQFCVPDRTRPHSGLRADARFTVCIPYPCPVCWRNGLLEKFALATLIALSELASGTVSPCCSRFPRRGRTLILTRNTAHRVRAFIWECSCKVK